MIDWLNSRLNCGHFVVISRVVWFYNLEKALNFSLRLEIKYLISLLGLENSVKFITLSTSDTMIS